MPNKELEYSLDEEKKKKLRRNFLNINKINTRNRERLKLQTQ